VSRSDNFEKRSASRKKKKRKLKHLITRSAYRELLLSKLMRPFEIIVVLLSPVFFLTGRMTGRGALARHRRTPKGDRANERPA
jgi:hypothetical protein